MWVRNPQLSNLRLDRITLGLGGPSHGAREHLARGPELGTHATFLAPSSAHHLRGNFRVVNMGGGMGCKVGIVYSGCAGHIGRSGYSVA